VDYFILKSKNFDINKHLRKSILFFVCLFVCLFVLLPSVKWASGQPYSQQRRTEFSPFLQKNPDVFKIISACLSKKREKLIITSYSVISFMPAPGSVTFNKETTEQPKIQHKKERCSV